MFLVGVHGRFANKRFLPNRSVRRLQADQIGDHGPGARLGVDVARDQGSPAAALPQEGRRQTLGQNRRYTGERQTLE